MRLLFDENLSPRLVARLADLFPGSAHVHDCGLGAADDALIWGYAATHHYVLASKDLDFHDRSVLCGAPPKLIWLRSGNCSTDAVELMMRRNLLQINRFVADPAAAVLVIA